MRKRAWISLLTAALMISGLTWGVGSVYAEMLFRTELSDAAVLSDNSMSTYYSRYASPTTSYLYEYEEELVRVEFCDGTIWVESYLNGVLQQSRQIEAELSLFGGFYTDGESCYLVFGESNAEESDAAEVVRVVRYDMDWNRLSSASLYGENTYVPFYAGSLSMESSGGVLSVLTCHSMYLSDDGYHHQANLFFQVNLETMTVQNVESKVWNISTGYVSHSFDQELRAAEDGTVFMVNHGDAYPRSMVLVKRTADGVVSNQNLLPIAGEEGDNTTGATLGDMELSETQVLTVGNSIVQDETAGSTTRNIWLSVTDQATLETELVWLTDYAEGSAVAVNTPYLTPLDGGGFLLCWQETENGVSYIRIMKLSSDGTPEGEPIYMAGSLSDCRPVQTSDGMVTWYWQTAANTWLYAVDPAVLEGYQGAGLRGDVNLDGAVDSDDAVLVLQYYTSTMLGAEPGWKEVRCLAADVDQTGSIDSDDAVRILNYYAVHLTGETPSWDF